MRVFILISMFSMLFALSAAADIVYMKSGEKTPGIVVEDYKDRIVLSTVDGEIEIMKSDIKQLRYDEELDNLIKLADQASDKGRYEIAAGYYSRALKVAPDSKAAEDGIRLMQLRLTEEWRSMAEKDAKMREDIDRFGSSIEYIESEEVEEQKSSEELRRRLGMLMESDDFMPWVYAVKPQSPAALAGIRKGDAIVAIWGRLTGYMTVKEISDYLMKKASAEIRCTIQRTITIPKVSGPRLFNNVDGKIGASFFMEFDGLTAKNIRPGGPAYNAGLRKGDLIVAINGRSTRYMPLKKALLIILNNRGSLKLTIRRDTIIWKSV